MFKKEKKECDYELIAEIYDEIYECNERMRRLYKEMYLSNNAIEKRKCELKIGKEKAGLKYWYSKLKRA